MRRIGSDSATLLLDLRPEYDRAVDSGAHVGEPRLRPLKGVNGFGVLVLEHCRPRLQIHALDGG